MAEKGFDGRPVCVLISDANFVGYHLAELILAQGCVVCVYSNQPETWVKDLHLLKDNEFLKIFSLTAAHPEACDYLFFMSGFTPTPSLVGLPLATALAKKFSPKFWVLLPFVCPNSVYEEIVTRAKEKVLEGDFAVELVFVGEVFGPRMNLALAWPTTQLISKAVDDEVLRAPAVDMEIYPVFVGDAVRAIVKAAFSYGFGEKETVLANRISLSSFLALLTKIKPALVVERQGTAFSFKVVPHTGYLPLADFEEKHLKDTLIWLTKTRNLLPAPVQQTPQQRPRKDFEILIRLPQLKIPKFPKVRIKKVSPVILAFTLIVALLSFPYAALGVSGLLLRRAYENFTDGNVDKVGFYLTAASSLTDVSVGGMRILSKAPVVGKWVGFGFDTALLVQQAARSGQTAMKVSALASEITSGIFGNGVDNLEALSGNLALELEALYQQTSFLESEAKGRFPELNALRFLAANSLGLVRNLPDLLGGEVTKTYLILLQNNMELRPTGGFIGSFALVTFTKGKLLDVAVMDVYSADGQLKGHVEPPLPIKYYLGEANWFLRDANWDADFPTAAAQIEWFLDKELDRSVDGVVAVDLEVAKAVLDQIGAVRLTDFNQTVDSRNLYERIQYEVEEDFFPGSRKKANLLSALASAILDQITKADGENYIALSKAMLTNLRQRHIQAFLHNKDAANSLADLGWDGRLVEPSCAGNCALSWFGMVEANVGVNKANYFIGRQMVLTSQVTSKEIANSLVVDIKNDSPASLGIAGKYKSYMRIILPGDSLVGEVVVDSGTKKETLTPEIFQKSGRTEAGVIVETASGQRTRVLFSWRIKANLDFTKAGEYQVFWRKQAGTISDSVSVNVSFPSGVEPAGDLVYNTSLSEDLAKSFFW